ncbi:helix-turn-helix domain-containing protein [Telmatospirillum sp.]|uniref:helix-turn-helix domain-containing protein n=1 Tax=Telmatospirillum sp. TaxID=2079197 RepID=UPI00283CA15A|nr:helix-turn-helix domain-containing protein [Telmatospirillum sp.]MDR3437048.1 AraC family ligand binding domain-containing protein [Telmatospirillum sp.]
MLDFLPSDIGFYPTATHHFVERKSGIAQAVLIYCVDGEGWAVLSGRQYRISPGTVLVTPPEVPHAYGADEQRPWTIYWVHVAGQKAASLARFLEIEDAPPLLCPGRNPSLPTLFDKTIAILERGCTTDNLLMASITLGQLLGQLIAHRHRHPGDEGVPDDRVKNAIGYMEKHLDRTIDIDELSKTLNTSRSHLAAVFKRNTGFSLLDFFIRMKIQRACTLLDTTDLPIKAISQQLGYDDQLYFSRCFRRIHDCSPVQYRSIMKG